MLQVADRAQSEIVARARVSSECHWREPREQEEPFVTPSGTEREKGVVGGKAAWGFVFHRERPQRNEAGN